LPIFRFNVPFSNRYLLITSKCSRHLVETRLIDETRKWLKINNNKKYDFPTRNLGNNNSGTDPADSLLPLYLVRNMSNICPEVINAKVMIREII